jgi:hypothetical protein
MQYLSDRNATSTAFRENCSGYGYIMADLEREEKIYCSVTATAINQTTVIWRCCQYNYRNITNIL